MAKKPMTSAERAIHWEDEGYLYVDPRGSWPELETSQADRTPQDDYCAGAIRDGVSCQVRVKPFRRRNGTIGTIYRTQITGIRNIAKELCLYRKHRVPRTTKKKVQLDRFIEALKRPRVKKRKSLLEALQLIASG